MTKTTHAEAAKRLCKQFPDVPSRTLAKRIAAECKVTVELARNAVRRVRGAAGDRERRQQSDKSLFRKLGKAGTKPQMPPSLAKKWEPFELGTGINVGVLSDIQIGRAHV